ncbi:MAG: hypothetical protein ABIR66_04310 [Saprospiraceae bacterium]
MKTIFNFIFSVLLMGSLFIGCTPEPKTNYTGTGTIQSAKEKLILNYPSISYPGANVLITIQYLEMEGDHYADVKWLADDYPRPEGVKKTETLTPTSVPSYMFTFPNISPGSSYYIRCAVIPHNGSTPVEKIVTIQYPN